MSLPAYEAPPGPRREESSTVFAFMKTLNGCKIEDFTSFKYCDPLLQPTDGEHAPSAVDVIAHMKLFQAFKVLKSKIVTDDKSDYSIKNWQVFVTNAVKRFIIYVTACQAQLNRHSTKLMEEQVLYDQARDPRCVDFFAGIMPPLDVILVWHSFLLNPKACYDTFMRNQFLEFAFYAFPLHRLNLAIDNHLFEYVPEEKAKLAYLEVVKPYSDDLTYDFVGFSMWEQLTDIYCPICQEMLLQSVPVTNTEETGFADPNFKMAANCFDCPCEFSLDITHQELCKRQLYADVKGFKMLPGTYKYLSGVIGERKFRERKAIFVKSEIKHMVHKELLKIDKTNLLEYIVEESTKTEIGQITRKTILRHYLKMNLVHLLVVQGFEIHEDLVGCVMRQERFVVKMNEMDWLHSPTINESLVESRLRYSRFFKLASDLYGGMLTPTLDIDLIWHTHQLSMAYYFQDCLESPRNCVVDHDDKVDQVRLNNNFENTSRVYRDKFGEEYSICYCSYCVQTRSNSRNKLKKLFSSLVPTKWKSSPLFAQSLTHISVHNAVSKPSLKAETGRQIIERSYGSSKDIPWNEFNYAAYPWLFVVPPLAPVGHSECIYYTSQLCMSAQDYRSACSGWGEIPDIKYYCAFIGLASA